MDAGFVLGAAFGVSRTQCQMDGAADLLIEQYVLDMLLDEVVHTDAELAQYHGAVIGLQ